MKTIVRQISKAALLSAIFFGVCAAYSDPIVTRFFISGGLIKLAGNPAGTWEPARIPSASGDCTSASQVFNCSKTGGTPFGTAATQNTGTSGANIPLLNGAHTWSGSDDFSGDSVVRVPAVTAGDNSSKAAPTSHLVANYAALATPNTYAGKQTFPAATTGGASINLPHGASPASPINGDLWTTTAGLYARINGVTQGPFATPTSGGKTLLNTVTCTGVASCQDTTSLTATYSEYDIVLVDVVPVSGTPVCQLLLQTGGTTFQTSGYSSYIQYFNGGGSAVTSTSSYTFCSQGVTGAVNLSLHLSNPSVSKKSYIFGTGMAAVAAGGSYVTQTGAVYDAAATITGVKLQFVGVNIASGTMKIYGSN